MSGKDNKATPLTEELLLKREADLKTESEKLEKEREVFEKAKSELDSEKSAFEAEKLDFQKAKESPESGTPEIEPGLEFDFEDVKGAFHPEAPKTILFNGQALTQKQIIDDKDVLLQLIGSKSDLLIINSN